MSLEENDFFINMQYDFCPERSCLPDIATTALQVGGTLATDQPFTCRYDIS